MNDLLIMEAANLFAGDANPDLSNHLAISELKLPTMEEATQDHMAGGAAVAVEFDTHMNKMEATFNLMGWNPDVMTLIGRWTAANQRFTALGAIRNRRTGTAQRATCIMWGRLGRVNPTNYRRSDLMQHEYSVKSIMHLELYLDKKELMYWDFWTNVRRVGGVDINADINAVLAIGSSSSDAREITTGNGVVNTAPGSISL